MQRLGRILGNVLAVMLAVLSMQAMAGAQLTGRDFDHSATGFPLVGGHATAACETCHVAGVFKGTPKTCDGCHALGRRIVATPKSTSHIVTDAPCETCHFNTSTFLGARFNHGTAIPGQCANCHNGRQSTGRPASHSIGLKATDSCDHCHRSYAFLPASWNHVGVVPHSCDSAGCHVAGSNQYYKPANHSVTPYMGRNTYYCDECHSFVSWLPGLFIHDRPGLCGTCHDASTAKGTVNDPNGLHIPLTAGGNPNCNLCHVSTTTFSAFSMNHGGITTCNACHWSGASPSYVVNTKSNHNGAGLTKDCSAAGCHTFGISWKAN